MSENFPSFDVGCSAIGWSNASGKLSLLGSVLCGIVICTFVYKLTELISIHCFAVYDKLTSAQKIEWNNRGISTIHAFLAASVSFYLAVVSDFFHDTSSPVPFIFRYNLLTISSMGVSVGYFLTDMAMLLWCFPALGGAEYLLHHGLSLFSLIYSIISGQAQFYILMALFTEVTTPMVNLRWYLDVSGLKNSKAYLYNGVSLFIGWLVARVVLFIFLFAHMFINFDDVKRISSFGFYSICTVPPLLAVLNFVWFLKIFKGMVKTIAKSKRTE